MATYVALLRGINVGGKRTITMERLRGVFEELGCQEVHTYIQSGNVVFDTTRRAERRLVDEIEAGITMSTGLDVPVVVRTARQLVEARHANPFAHNEQDAALSHVVFLPAAPAADALDDLDREAYRPEAVALRGRQIYLYLPNGMGRARLPAGPLDRLVGMAGTARNWKTVTALGDLVGRCGAR